MAIRARCECGKVLYAADSAAGRKGRCPGCGRLVLVPTLDFGVAAPLFSDGTVPPPRRDAPEKSDVSDRSDTSDTSLDVGRPRVLIADIIPGDIEVLSRGFKEHGYKIIYTTNNGNDVVDKVRELKPDIAVVDVRLQGSSGFRVVRTLTDPLNPRNKDVWQTLFVMTTSDLHGRDKQYALSLGVEIFVEKPYIPTRIFPRINKRLKRHSPSEA